MKKICHIISTFGVITYLKSTFYMKFIYTLHLDERKLMNETSKNNITTTKQK